MKRTLLLTLLLLGNTVYSQHSVRLDSRVNINYQSVDNDTGRIYLINGSFIDFKLITYLRPNEYFVLSDTTNRDYIQVNNSHFIIDSLLNISNDYTVAYSLIAFYKIDKKDKTYFIFEGGDIFPLGTEATVCYILFEKSGDKLQFVSSYEYERDRPYKKIRIIFSKKGIKLKGKYLKPITRGSVIEP